MSLLNDYMQKEQMLKQLTDELQKMENDNRLKSELEFKEKLEALNYSSALTQMDAAHGVCAGDYDGDGRPDLFYANPYGGHRLYRNLGGFRFEDVTEKAGLTKIVADHWAIGCCFVDHDGDGDLDLFLALRDRANKLFRNQGTSGFADVTDEVNIGDPRRTVGAVWFDMDQDGDLDL